MLPSTSSRTCIRPSKGQWWQGMILRGVPPWTVLRPCHKPLGWPLQHHVCLLKGGSPKGWNIRDAWKNICKREGRAHAWWHLIFFPRWLSQSIYLGVPWFRTPWSLCMYYIINIITGTINYFCAWPFSLYSTQVNSLRICLFLYHSFSLCSLFILHTCSFLYLISFLF